MWVRSCVNIILDALWQLWLGLRVVSDWSERGKKKNSLHFVNVFNRVSFWTKSDSIYTKTLYIIILCDSTSSNNHRRLMHTIKLINQMGFSSLILDPKILIRCSHWIPPIRIGHVHCQWHGLNLLSITNSQP